LILHIENLGIDVTCHQLTAAFSKYGTVLEAQVTLDPHTGRSTGHAILTMDDREAILARRCIAGVHWGSLSRVNVSEWRGTGCKKCKAA
jgi:hypothetical protein